MLHLDYSMFILQQSIEFLSAPVFWPPQHPVVKFSYVPHEKELPCIFSVLLEDTTIFWKPAGLEKNTTLILCNKEGIFPGSYWLTSSTQFEQRMLYHMHPFSNSVAGIL